MLNFLNSINILWLRKTTPNNFCLKETYSKIFRGKGEGRLQALLKWFRKKHVL